MSLFPYSSPTFDNSRWKFLDPVYYCFTIFSCSCLLETLDVEFLLFDPFTVTSDLSCLFGSGQTPDQQVVVDSSAGLIFTWCHLVAILLSLQCVVNTYYTCSSSLLPVGSMLFLPRHPNLPFSMLEFSCCHHYHCWIWFYHPYLVPS